MQKQKITVAIVTKNRPEKLARLLSSIVRQSVKPLKIIVVDNDVKQSAKEVVSCFSNRLSIKYFLEKKEGVPFARNKALKVVKTPYLAFIDDDCVVDQNWVFVAERVVNKLPKTSYFIGNSLLLNHKNLIAVAQYVYQKYWFMQMLKPNHRSSPFNVDTKNIIFKVSDLKKHKLKFDIDFKIGWFDNADVDMGFSMSEKNINGKFVERLKLWHEETTSFRYFLKKGYSRGRLAYMVAQKWSLKGEFVNLGFLNWKTYLKSIRYWPGEYKKYFSIMKKRNVLSFLLIKLDEVFLLKGYVRQAQEMGVTLTATS